MQSNFIKNISKLKIIIYILRTKSKVLFIKGIIKNFNSHQKTSYNKIVKSFEEYINLKDMDNKWKNNTNRFISWSEIFLSKFQRDEHLKLLEIGSCQGHSALFFLWFFKNCHIDCVDVWDRFTKLGSAENNKRDERLFNENLRDFSGRFRKLKLFSIEFFSENFSQRGIYDIVFIDGSHHSEEVLSDCLHCFQLLKVNGLMIIDDVFFMCNDRYNDNSLKAIDLFLDLKKQDLKVIKLNSQLFIQKTSDLRMESSKTLNY